MNIDHSDSDFSATFARLNRQTRMLFVMKLLWLGLFLPALDFGTDMVAIYKYWTSGQWVLHYLSRGLLLSILLNNLVSATYHQKKMCVLNPNGSNVWRYASTMVFAMGFGHAYVAIGILADLILKTNIGMR